jgi:hypothetical protein
MWPDKMVSDMGGDEMKVPIGWRCNACGEFITRIEDGWVEWLAGEDEDGDTTLKGLRLVHRIGTGRRSKSYACQYDGRREFRNDLSIVEGLSLERFMGPDGLMLILSLIACREMPEQDVLELAKRVQIPGYEQARDFFPEAIAEGVVEPSIGEGYYLQGEIQTLLRWAMAEGGSPKEAA